MFGFGRKDKVSMVLRHSQYYEDFLKAFRGGLRVVLPLAQVAPDPAESVGGVTYIDVVAFDKNFVVGIDVEKPGLFGLTLLDGEQGFDNSLGDCVFGHMETMIKYMARLAK